MAVIDIRINAQNDASRQLLQLRANMNALNRTLADQRVALSKAEGAERANIQGKINATRAAQTQNRLEQQTLTLKRQFIAQGQRELRQQEALERQQAKVSRSIETTSRHYGGWLDRLANSAFIYSAVGYELTHLIKSTVRVGAETERYQAVLRATETNYESVYRQLQLLNRELIGTDFATINRTFLSLRAAGTGLDDTITTVRGLSRALGQLQVDAYDQQRFFTQLTQSYAQNKLELDEFKILQETLPNVLRLSSRALNTEINSYQKLKDVLADGNQSAREYYVTLARFAEQNIAGIDPTTYTAQVEQFRESVREIQRDISQVLIPILARGAGEARNFVEFFGGTSRGDIAAFVTSIVGVSSVVRILTAVYGQWNLASQLVNATTLTTGATAARLTLTLQGLTLGLRTMTGNLWANIAAANAAGISWSAALGIITATTAAFGYLGIKLHIARQQTDDFTKTMGELGKAFNQVVAEGEKVQFGDLGERQLQQSINTAVEGRRRLAAEIRALVSEELNTDSIFPLPDVNLLPSLANLSEFQSALHSLSRQLDAGADLEPFVLRQYADLKKVLAVLDPLIVQYGIYNRTIATYKNRLTEVQAAEKSDAQAKAAQDVRLGELQVALARADQRLARTGSALRQALAGEDVSAIEKATAAEVSALNKRAAVRQQLLKAEGQQRESSEENTLKDEAESIRIQTRLDAEKARLEERSMARIAALRVSAARLETQRIEAALKQQTDALAAELQAQQAATKAYLQHILKSYQESADARIGFEKAVTDQYTAEFARRQESEERATAAGVARQARQNVAREKALETARQLARIDGALKLGQRDRAGFSLGSGIAQRTPATGSAELFNEAFAEYQRALGEFQTKVQRDADSRLDPIPGFDVRIRQRVEREKKAADEAAAHQKRVYREMERDARQWSRLVVGFIDDVAISRNRGVKEALTAFLQASVKRLLQDFIETQLLIANQKRYQKELLKTAALKAAAGQQRSNTSVVASAAAGVASGGNPLVAALGSLLPQALQVFVQIGENQAEQVTQLSQAANRRRSPP